MMTAAIVTAYLLCQKMQIDTIYNLPHTNHNGLKSILKVFSDFHVSLLDPTNGQQVLSQIQMILDDYK